MVTLDQTDHEPAAYYDGEETEGFLAPSPIPYEKETPLIRQLSIESVDSVNYQKGDYSNALPSFLRGYIGSALLAMPYNFQLVGIGWGIVLTILCVLSNQYVMKLIVLVCDDCKISRSAWGKMCYRVSGWKFKLFAELALLVSQVGMCIGESIFALRFLNYVFCQLAVDSLCDAYFAHVGMILIVIIPLTAITNMYFLSIPNEVASYVTIGFIMFVVGVGLGELSSFSDAWHHLADTFFVAHFDSSLLFCGTLLYAVGGVGAILDVRASMSDKRQFHRVLRNGMIIVGGIHAFFGSFAFMVNRGDTKEIYLYNLPLTTTSLVIQALFLFTIPMTYATNQYPIMSTVEYWVDPKRQYFFPNRTEGGLKMLALRYSMRYAIVAIIVTIAMVAPSFNLFLSFIGSFNFAVMNGLIPVIAFSIRFRGRMPTWRKVCNVLMLVVAVVVGIVGMVQSLQDMIEMERHPNDVVKVEFIK